MKVCKGKKLHILLLSAMTHLSAPSEWCLGSYYCAMQSREIQEIDFLNEFQASLPLSSEDGSIHILSAWILVFLAKRK